MSTQSRVQPLPHAPAPSRIRGVLSRDVGTWMWALFLVDACVLLGAALVAWQARLHLNPLFPEAISPTTIIPAETMGLILLWLAALYVQGGYSFRHIEAGFDLYRALGTASLLACGCAAIAMYLTERDFNRTFFLLFFLLGLTLLTTERYVLRQRLFSARRRGQLGHRVLAIGDPASITDAMTVFSRESHLGYAIVGVVTSNGAPPAPLPVAHLGAVEDLARLCEQYEVDTVLVAGGSCSATDLREVCWSLHGRSVDVIVLPSLLDVAGPRVHFRVDGGLPRVHVTEPQASRAVSIGKRLFDLVVSAVLILVLALPVLVLAAVITVSDGGPVLFRQLRVGMNGETFRCLKFRSMTQGADGVEALLRAGQNHQGALWKMHDDPRVTRCGAFIRRYSIDELPQLLNVIKGDMSLVGPRPQQQWEVDTYSAQQRRRLLVKPGMTGLWQVSGRSNLSLEEAVRLDLYYVENWTMFVDLVIIGRTLRAVFGSEGAY